MYVEDMILLVSSLIVVNMAYEMKLLQVLLKHEIRMQMDQIKQNEDQVNTFLTQQEANLFMTDSKY